LPASAGWRRAKPAAAMPGLVIDTGTLPFDGVQLGESIAVNGCCLTVVEFDATSFAVDASEPRRWH